MLFHAETQSHPKKCRQKLITNSEHPRDSSSTTRYTPLPLSESISAIHAGQLKQPLSSIVPPARLPHQAPNHEPEIFRFVEIHSLEQRVLGDAHRSAGLQKVGNVFHLDGGGSAENNREEKQQHRSNNTAAVLVLRNRVHDDAVPPRPTSPGPARAHRQRRKKHSALASSAVQARDERRSEGSFQQASKLFRG